MLSLIWISSVISHISVRCSKDDAVRFFSQTMFTPAALIGSAALGLLFLPPAKFAFCDPHQQPYRIFQFLYRATWISTGGVLCHWMCQVVVRSISLYLVASWAIIGMLVQKQAYRDISIIRNKAHVQRYLEGYGGRVQTLSKKWQMGIGWRTILDFLLCSIGLARFKSPFNSIESSQSYSNHIGKEHAATPAKSLFSKNN